MSALPEVVTIAPGLTREDWWWGRLWEGTAEALLVAGVVEPGLLADGSERDKRGRVVRTKKAERDGRQLKVQRVSPRRYQVRERYTEAEIAQLREREQLADELRDQARHLASLPASHEQFRERCAGAALVLLTSLELPIGHVMRGERLGGYCYSPEALARISEARDDLVRSLLQGETSFSPKAQTEDVTSIRARAAAADPGLQDFLQRMQTSAREQGGHP